MPSRTHQLILLLVITSIFAASCGSSTTSTTIQPGSPAFYWAGAKQAYGSGDYLRASENLSKLTQSDNEFRSRAQAWLIVLNAGITKGYMEVAEAYDLGAKANRENALAFRRQASAARTKAKGSLLTLVESVHYFNDKVKDPNIVFEFGAPTGRLAEIPNLLKVAKGIMPQAADAESTMSTAVQKGVVWSAARAVGAGEDSAKAAEIFKQSPAQVSREQFMVGVASALAEEAELFGPKQLDEPQRLKMLCGEAAEALKQAPSSKETKEVEARIQKLMKTIKPS